MQFLLVSTDASPTSASAAAVHVMLRRTLSNTLPMMQSSPGGAAHTFGVVRETGGAGRTASCEPKQANANGFMLK